MSVTQVQTSGLHTSHRDTLSAYVICYVFTPFTVMRNSSALESAGPNATSGINSNRPFSITHMTFHTCNKVKRSEQIYVVSVLAQPYSSKLLFLIQQQLGVHYLAAITVFWM